MKSVPPVQHDDFFFFNPIIFLFCSVVVAVAAAQCEEKAKKTASRGGLRSSVFPHPVRRDLKYQRSLT